MNTPDVNAQLRIGLVGAGPWATNVHAPGIAEHPGVRLTAVWARRRAAAEELAVPYGAMVADDFLELLNAVDAVAFAVPPSIQASLATQAALAGKHVILEKPIASDLESAQRLADAVSTSGVASIVVLTRRFAPEIRDWLTELSGLDGWAGGAARWLTGGVLGGVYAGSPWRHSEGALSDIGPHAIDLLDAALGSVSEVLAAHRTRDDLWHLTLAHAGGATSTISLSLRLPLRPSLVDLTVYGEHGHRSLPSRETSSQDCYRTLLDEFVALVHSRLTSHPCDVSRGLHLQRVLDAARGLADGAE